MRVLCSVSIAAATFFHLVTACPSAEAGITYIEAVDGELSGDRLAPTALSLGVGANVITGTFGQSGIPDMPELDYVTLTIPAGFQLEQLKVVVADVGGAFSFIGVQFGPIISVPYDTHDASPLLGWTHFGSADEGLDILQFIGSGRGAIGFSGPLPPGDYTFWLMELDTDRVCDYSFNFVVTSTCKPDFNVDGFLTGDDFDALVAAFQAGDVDADYLGDGFVTGDDFDAFAEDFVAGC